MCEVGVIPGALAIVIVTRSVRRGSSSAVAGAKPGTSGGRRAMEYCFFECVRWYQEKIN